MNKIPSFSDTSTAIRNRSKHVRRKLKVAKNSDMQNKGTNGTNGTNEAGMKDCHNSAKNAYSQNSTKNANSQNAKNAYSQNSSKNSAKNASGSNSTDSYSR